MLFTNFAASIISLGAITPACKKAKRRSGRSCRSGSKGLKPCFGCKVLFTSFRRCLFAIPQQDQYPKGPSTPPKKVFWGGLGGLNPFSGGTKGPLGIGCGFIITLQRLDIGTSKRLPKTSSSQKLCPSNPERPPST